MVKRTYKTKKELRKRIIYTDAQMKCMKKGLFKKNGKWYYEAYCLMAKQQRKKNK
jgi:glucan-binding YG repeat protein